jgi:hypothetical protein
MVGTAALVVAAVTLLSIVPEALVLSGLAANPVFVAGGAPSVADEADAAVVQLEAQAAPLLLTFVAVVVLNALLIVPVSAAVLGRRVTAGEMWRRARPRLWAALGVALLTVLGAAVVAVAAVIPGVVVLVIGVEGLGVVLLVAGVAGGIVLALLVGVRWSLAAPALILEEQKVTGALRRSWRLVNGTAWRVFGILLLSGIIVGIGRAIITVPTALLSGLPAAGQASPYESLPVTFLQLLIAGVGTVAAGAIFYPFSAAVSALLYIDLRMRREGLDVRLAQSAADAAARP